MKDCDVRNYIPDFFFKCLRLCAIIYGFGFRKVVFLLSWVISKITKLWEVKNLIWGSGIYTKYLLYKGTFFFFFCSQFFTNFFAITLLFYFTIVICSFAVPYSCSYSSIIYLFNFFLSYIQCSECMGKQQSYINIMKHRGLRLRLCQCGTTQGRVCLAFCSHPAMP